MSPKKLVHKLDEQYRQQFQNFRTETYQMIINDRTTALKYAKIGIEKTDPTNISTENIEKVADILESVAKLILKQKEGKDIKRTNELLRAYARSFLQGKLRLS